MSGYERNMYSGWASIKAQAIVSTHKYFHCHSHLSAGYALGIMLYVEVLGENCTGVSPPVLDLPWLHLHCCSSSSLNQVLSQ
jgi:hypothetical protein